MKMIRRNQKGFTLIEALIVVIIVAILAVLGISRFLGVREATATATCQSHLSTLNSAVKKWELTNNATFDDTVPANITAVKLDAGNPTCPTTGADTYGFTPSDSDGDGINDEFVATCTNGHVINP
jgi:prepilin-type N-terminal cleavage/methylation domain-containing protein